MLKFDPHCRRCPRLASFLDEVHLRHPDYHCAPVGSIGSESAGLLIVGLAPGLHGANASGEPFIGDRSGALLFRTLQSVGFAQAVDNRGAGLRGCRITNAVKCVPPHNRPLAAEVSTCNGFLAYELARLRPGGVVLALGRIAHNAVMMALGQRQSGRPFAHGRLHPLDHLFVLDSYHCSRYNIQTRRLTEPMFEAVVARARNLLETS